MQQLAKRKNRIIITEFYSKVLQMIAATVVSIISRDSS
jgi:hypothetical protein